MKFSYLYLLAFCFMQLMPINQLYAEDPPNWELSARDEFLVHPVSLIGTVLNLYGDPLENAAVSIAGATQYADAQGAFEFQGLSRKNDLLSVSITGYHNEIIPVHLAQDINIETIALDPIYLSMRETGDVRFLFAGDASFARRFLDADESTPLDQIPPDDPDALIKTSNPDPGSRSLFEYIRPYYQAADWGVVNLETPVTDNPITPHMQKDYAYFSLPASLPSLLWLGVDYVSLGNNHVYDYLESGIIDTIQSLNESGIPHSGAGLTSEEAFQAYRVTLGGSLFGLLSMTSVTGRQHPVSYVAETQKGGAADLTLDDEVIASIQREIDAGYIPIAQLHGGQEYTYQPTDYTYGRMELVAENGASLVIGHHPHVAQGIGLINGIITVHSLGNFAFDQDRLETMLGLLASVDMNGDQVQKIRLIPIYLEDYRPRPITGQLADVFLRHICEFSHGYGLQVYPYQNQVWIALENKDVIADDRTVDLTISVPESGEIIIDLREWNMKYESLAGFDINAPSATIQLGRDILHFGDFDDWDIDDMSFEAERWDISGISRFVTITDSYRGISSLCSNRDMNNSDPSFMPFRNRIRVMGDSEGNPNKKLSLYGYMKGVNAGNIEIYARYYASSGDADYGAETLVLHPGGDFEWTPVWADMHMPDDIEGLEDSTANPRATRIFMRHDPPLNGEAYAYFDEIAVVNWEESIQSGMDIPTPHAKDFLRIHAQPGEHSITLRFRSYSPEHLEKTGVRDFMIH